MEAPSTMDALQLTSDQVETLINVPKRRVNEMAARGIIPSIRVGGGEKKVRRAFSMRDLNTIKEQYELHYPQRRPGVNRATAVRLDEMEDQIAGLVDAVNQLYSELGYTAPTRNTPGNEAGTASTGSGE